MGTLLLGFVFTVLYCVAYDFFFPYPDTYNSEKKQKNRSEPIGVKMKMKSDLWSILGIYYIHIPTRKRERR